MKKLTSMVFNLPRRWLYLVGAVIIAGLFCAALYLEYVLHQEPCPLCMVQRVVFIVMGVLFAIATVHNPKRTGAKVYSALIGLFALFGIAVASRHIWIQHLPKEEVPACSPPPGLHAGTPSHGKSNEGVDAWLRRVRHPGLGVPGDGNSGVVAVVVHPARHLGAADRLQSQQAVTGAEPSPVVRYPD